MPINASPEYYKAYAEYLNALTIEEKIRRLEEVKKESEVKRKRRSSSRGIKKTGDAQVVIIGIENSGKSSLLSILTNASPKISEIPFATIKPEIGTMDLEGLKVQMI